MIVTVVTVAAVPVVRVVFLFLAFKVLLYTLVFLREVMKSTLNHYLDP